MCHCGKKLAGSASLTGGLFSSTSPWRSRLPSCTVLTVAADVLGNLQQPAVDNSAASRALPPLSRAGGNRIRSEEHTSELQSRLHIVCRLLLEKKKAQLVHHRNKRL